MRKEREATLTVEAVTGWPDTPVGHGVRYPEKPPRNRRDWEKNARQECRAYRDFHKSFVIMKISMNRLPSIYRSIREKREQNRYKSGQIRNILGTIQNSSVVGGMMFLPYGVSPNVQYYYLIVATGITNLAVKKLP
jgi:hypothetical protein